MKEKLYTPPSAKQRQSILTAQRNRKMARSAHAYVRGNTLQFYEWLESLTEHTLPEGPAIWICGDCHAGNLGPVANAKGHIDIQIRDLDQTVIGNPAHDLIRLGLSLATAARGSDLPGVTTAKMLEQVMDGYQEAFLENPDTSEDSEQMPQTVKTAMKLAMNRSWKHLARERIEGIERSIPLGKRFWPLARDEKRELKELFASKSVHQLATSLRSRDDDAEVHLLDAAYWMKGCSSLGRLRFAVLLRIGDAEDKDFCLMDIKEAIQSAAPRYTDVKMPRNNAERVVTGAQNLAPYLGKRMLATTVLDRSVFIRELLPQDLKLDIDQLTEVEAMKAAHFLALVVGKAHARQMDAATQKSWQQELKRNRSKTLDAPSWLWSSIVQLIMNHEGAYLEHCRRYAINAE
ncbi:MAG: hypothetical protein JWM78_1010 [Verrucomicrobiaceae bacterium]|nr:hypothetical protein [Verrucomicrobiaceae bacterium]